MSLRFCIMATAMSLSATISACAQSFPLTVDHVYGQTVIEAKPERIITWGWVTQDVVIALGETPVAIPHFQYGGDQEGMLTWTRDALSAMGATTTVLANSPTPPYEQILALDPDVILAPHSGITADEYERLSQIAPVVAFPDAAWATPTNTVIEITGKVLGKSAEAAALIAELDQFSAEEAAKYPQLQGVTFASFRTGDDVAYAYNRNAAGVPFLETMGLVQADSVEALDNGDSYYFNLSFENFGELRGDILVGFFDDQPSADRFIQHDYIRQTPQISAGAIATIIGADLDVAISPPSPLSLRWALPLYLERVAAAVDAVN